MPNTAEICTGAVLSYLSSFWDKVSWKTSLLVRSEILGLFVNTLTVDYKYSLHNKGNLRQTVQMHLSQNSKIFYCIFGLYMNCWREWKKSWVPYFKYLRNYRLQKTWLLKCIKGPVSEPPLAVKLLTGTKHCWNLTRAVLSYFFIILR